MPDFAKFKRDINATKVPVALLGEVMIMYAMMPPDERNQFEARANRVLDLLANKGYGKECGFLAMAITIRLMALDAVLDDRGVQGWIISGSEPRII